MNFLFKSPALQTRHQRHLNNGLSFILLLFSASAYQYAQAEETVITSMPEPIEIEGDKLDLYLDRKMRASGNATMRRGNQSVAGNNIEYDILNDELTVDGNASIEVDGTIINGPKLKMRLTENIGEMKNASVTLGNIVTTSENNAGESQLLDGQTPNNSDPKRYLSNNASLTNNVEIKQAIKNARGDAETVLFNGPDKKQLKNARFTTCAADVDDWYIKADDLKLNDHTQRAVAKHAYVEFKGVPILYTPWLSFSYNNQRESGMLAPTIGATSRGGFEVLTPFYWNIRPDMDATIGARYMSNRGLQMQGEYRYLDERYSGVSNIEYLNNDSETDKRRYFVNLIHRHNFGQGWTGGFNFERVSDDRYFSELSSNIASTSQVNLSQDAFINFNNGAWNFNGMVQRYQTLDNLSYAYSRLPQLTLSHYKEYGNINTQFFSQYTYFDRNDEAPLAATGSRFILNPSISMPLGNAFGFITPKLGFNLATYSLSNNTYVVNGTTVNRSSQNRALPMLSLDGGMYLDAEKNYFGTGYTQTLEPRMFYVYIPNKDQSQTPVFDTGLADLNLTTLFTENQFTGGDRVNDANQLSLALTTRLIDSATGIERIAATIGQRFYFDNPQVTLPNTAASTRDTSDLIAGFTANLSSKLKLDAFWQYNPDSSNMQRSNVLARYNPEPGKLLNMGYRYTEGLLEQVDVSAQWPLGSGWYGVSRVNYSLREKTPVETLFGLEYDKGCWQARAVLQRLNTATADANYSLFFQLELGGLASIGSNPLNLLRRDIPGYMSSGQLPDFYRQQNYAQ